MIEKESSTNQLVENVVEGIEDVKGEEILVLDLQDIDTAVCDFFVICNGNSNTHVNAIVQSVKKTVSKALHEKPWQVEGTQNGEWVLMDYVNVVVHVFQQQTRAFYDLEGLWGDAKPVVLEEN